MARPRKLPSTDEGLHKLYAKSFVDWSESDYGFYVTRRWNGESWDHVQGPIVWRPHQRRVFRYLFTLRRDGRFPIDEFYMFDVGQSGKSTFGAAITQWVTMYFERHSLGQVAANSKEQAGGRVYRAIKTSFLLNPYGPELADIQEQKIAIHATGNEIIPVPFNAATQAGGAPVIREADEIWNWEWSTPAAREFVAELKPTPTRKISLLVATTYPPYADVPGYANDVLNLFMDSKETPLDGVTKVKGLEDLPLWVSGRRALFWNHDPKLYPWNTDEWLAARRSEPGIHPNAYLRIWEARRVSSIGTFIPMDKWDACLDRHHQPLQRDQRNIPLVLGVDIGIKHDSSAVVARGYDALTDRLPLWDYAIWTPAMFKEDKRDVINRVKDYIASLDEKQRVLAVYYDPSQFQDAARELRRAGINMVEVTQNTSRLAADTNYYGLIVDGRLRNYPQSGSLREHIKNAVGLQREDRIRLSKLKSSQKIDAAVADSMACWGVMENMERFKALGRRRRVEPRAKRVSPFVAGIGVRA